MAEDEREPERPPEDRPPGFWRRLWRVLASAKATAPRIGRRPPTAGDGPPNRLGRDQW